MINVAQQTTIIAVKANGRSAKYFGRSDSIITCMIHVMPANHAAQRRRKL